MRGSRYYLVYFVGMRRLARSVPTIISPAKPPASTALRQSTCVKGPPAALSACFREESSTASLARSAQGRLLQQNRPFCDIAGRQENVRYRVQRRPSSMIDSDPKTFGRKERRPGMITNCHQLPPPISVPDRGWRRRKTTEISVVSRTIVCCTRSPLATQFADCITCHACEGPSLHMSGFGARPENICSS
jgi:hypothetical protein